jgi:predicted ATP-dependent protease
MEGCQMEEKHRLKPEDLRKSYRPQNLTFKDTSEVDPLEDVIGQDRAMQAIRFGIEMQRPGYHIFVTGREGTGRTTIVGEFARKHAESLPTPDDWCMVHNFQDPFRPKALRLPAGQSGRFAKRMDRLIRDLQIRLPKEFETESYRQRTAEILDHHRLKQEQNFDDLQGRAAEQGFQIVRSSSGYQVVPLREGKPVPQEEYETLPEDQKAEIDARARRLRRDTETVLHENRKIQQAMQKEVENLKEEVALFIVEDRLELLREDYHDCADVQAYLDAVQMDLVENITLFLEDAKTGAEKVSLPDDADAFRKYRINVLVDRTGTQGAPVVFEPNPSFPNTFGHIEKRALAGALSTDFTRVQAGSLLQANGGFLILEIAAILMNPMVWEALKRSLQKKQLYIEDPATGSGTSIAALRPEPIPLEVKVILIGDYPTFETLQNFDSRFNKIFKVRADFDYETESNEQTIEQYAQFVARICREGTLPPFTAGAVAAVLEYGATLVPDQQKLSLRLGPVAAVVEEAVYWAGRNGNSAVTQADVGRAVQQQRHRLSLYEEKIREACLNDIYMIAVEGRRVGQVNALTVHQMGDFVFGRPSRITAETFMGRRGVINIEREARLSGRTHDKGVLILAGYLGAKFAQKFPLNLSISITFEQNYGGVDGDSASSTELYAILSSLSGLSIRQGLAVTGSVNQKGDIQAIGGANAKIEGFFDVCNTKGLSGRQGVLIPRTNVRNLMVKKEVVDAVRDGRFHVYAIATVEEGIELLTGVPAGTPNAEGDYGEETVFGAVQAKLKQYLTQAYRIKKEFDDLF